MPITITLSNIDPSAIALDIDRRVVIVSYYLIDDAGVRNGDVQEAYFWQTIPDPGTDPEGTPLPTPSNWYQIPSGYMTNLVQLRNDVVAAILARIMP